MASHTASLPRSYGSTHDSTYEITKSMNRKRNTHLSDGGARTDQANPSSVSENTRLSNSDTREPNSRRPRKKDNTQIFIYRYITDDEPTTYILPLSSSEGSKEAMLSYMKVRGQHFPLNRLLLPRRENRANRRVGQHKLPRRFP